MPTVGVGNLTPAELAKRAEQAGARVEYLNHKYKVYPKNPAVSPVFFSDRFTNGHDRSNAIAHLRRAGIDITPEKETAMAAPTTNGTPTPNAMPKTAAPVPAGVLANLDQQLKALTALLTDSDAAHNTQMKALEDRIKQLEERLAATPGAPAARDVDAELDAAIIEFVERIGIKLPAKVVTANLPASFKASGNKVGKRLQGLAAAGKVIATGEGFDRMYERVLKEAA